MSVNSDDVSATCTRTKLMEIVKIRYLTFQSLFSCVSNYTPLLPFTFILTFSLRSIKQVPNLSPSRLNCHPLHFTKIIIIIGDHPWKRFGFEVRFCGLSRMEDSITVILHHGGCLERDEYRRLQYVDGEFCVWEKMDVDQLCLWDIEKMAKRCRGSH
ncbi:hypothetical protein MTR_5g069870 [Medicago truncatula]|uniref:PB1-like domain-containing protein n=1 Tax=Medicago truncatula TaxID=3880 RepID=G7K6B2_MEDTR|nr:hypothetical protein MTR_5g069870 [Medicago truncatula]